MLRSNIAGQRTNTIGCRRWRPIAIASLKEQVGALGVPEWRALRECRRGLGALLATIEGRTHS